MGPLPLRRIDPTDTRSHPQGGVQIYPKGKFTRQNLEKNFASSAHYANRDGDINCNIDL